MHKSIEHPYFVHPIQTHKSEQAKVPENQRRCLQFFRFFAPSFFTDDSRPSLHKANFGCNGVVAHVLLKFAHLNELHVIRLFWFLLGWDGVRDVLEFVVS
jgi:hypothetical protein